MSGIGLFVCAQDTGVFFSVFLSVPGWKKWGEGIHGRAFCGDPRHLPYALAGCSGGVDCARTRSRRWHWGASGILRGPGGGEVLVNARLLRALRASPVGQPASHRWQAPRPNVSHNSSCSTCCPLPRSSPPRSTSVSASQGSFRHGTQTPPPPFIRSQERAASGKCCDGPTRGMPREGSGASGIKKKKNATPVRARSAARTPAHRR